MAKMIYDTLKLLMSGSVTNDVANFIKSVINALQTLMSDDQVPMHARQALRLFKSENYCIYKLYQNNTKSEVIFDDDIEEGYLYGVEYNRKDAYEWLMSVLDEDGPLVWKEGQKIYCKNVSFVMGF